MVETQLIPKTSSQCYRFTGSNSADPDGQIVSYAWALGNGNTRTGPVRDDDGDGLTNEEEQRLGTDPLNPDSDYDGLSDGHEAGSCTNPLDPDTDGDYLLDGDEVNRGSDPCDPNDPYPPTWPLTPTPTPRFTEGHDNVWPPGDYAVQMEVDYESLINEANENNNFSSTLDFKVIPPNSGPQDFIGNWYNIDPNTRGTTRIDIGQEGDVTFVHGYGSCSPTDCDWGTVAAYASGSSLIAEYKFSFKVSHLEMTLEGGRLRVYSTHRFTDGTDRDYDLTEYFDRQRVQ